MLVNMKNDAYLAPTLSIIEVACEEGFLGSTGDFTYNKGVDDGWYSL